MITCYTWKTPNGRKVAIMLEETGLEHEIEPIDITEGEQHDPAFLAVSPNNKIPAIVDQRDDGTTLSLFESGAILTYLAEKSGMLLPAGDDRWTTLQWLHWSIGGIGPMLGQLNHFVNHADAKIPYAIERYTDEAKRLLGVLERQLSSSEWIAAGQYTIADIVSYPWIVEARESLPEQLGDTFAQSPAIGSWCDRVGRRPAVEAGMHVLEGSAD